MKIAQSSLHSEGMSLAWQRSQHALEARIQMDTASSRQRLTGGTQTTISNAGRNAQQSEEISGSDPHSSAEPRLQLLISIIEALTGRRIEFYEGDSAPAQDSHANATPSPPPAPQTTWRISISESHIHEEMEMASYQASGNVTTADGRQIDFSLSLLMQRYQREESHSQIDISNAPKAKDPLILNLSTDQVRLEAGTFSFDLNVDGKTDTLARLAAGSAFLALDRNGNGQIDSGQELFGPTTGNGFQELSTLDQDGNGWIDENDTAFKQLSVWRPGEALQSLKTAQVGAIALDRVGTDFTLKAGENIAGQVRSTGLFLSEAGQAKTLQQIDLVV